MTLFVEKKNMWNTWKEYTYTDEEIKNKAYQEGIGGGSKEWVSRGELQLVFLKAVGLQPHHIVIDIGCGPLRAGEHLIRYIKSGNYIGFDYNRTYIEIAKKIIHENSDLSQKKPEVFCIDEFDLAENSTQLGDFGIAFSVLNHCQQGEVQQFFRNIGKSFKKGGKIYTMNANTIWYPKWYPSGCNLQPTQYFDTVSQLGIDINQYFVGLEKQLTGPNKKFAIEFTKT